MTLKYSSIFDFNLLLVNKWSDFVFKEGDKKCCGFE